MSSELVAVPGAPMVAVERVSKWFRSVVAVSEVSFELGPGVTALLGPNGAGKSTVLRMVCGLCAPSEGAVRIGGHDPRGDPRVLRYVGLVPQQEALFGRMTALEFVELAAVLHAVEQPTDRSAATLSSLGLDPGDRRPVGSYSKGMRQRVKLAQALVHGPSVVVADEPLNGLDPRQRRSVIELFGRLAAEGRCVVVSSHVLEEVERFGSRVLVMAQGRLAAQGDFHEIRALMDDRPHRVRVVSRGARELAAALLYRGAATGATLGGTSVLFEVADLPRFARSIMPTAADLDIDVAEVRPLDDDLESVFRYLVGAPVVGSGR